MGISKFGGPINSFTYAEIVDTFPTNSSNALYNYVRNTINQGLSKTQIRSASRYFEFLNQEGFETYLTNGTHYALKRWTQTGSYTHDGSLFNGQNVELFCLGGGGGGASGVYSGGGGGGGYVYNSSYLMNSSSNISVTVGIGGAGGAPGAQNTGTDGGNSIFANIVSNGGGGGGGHGNGGIEGRSGGSGGGGCHHSGTSYRNGGLAVTGQGHSGSSGGQSAGTGGGGGGAGGPSNYGFSQATSARTRNGGPGLTNSIIGTSTHYGAGGGGGDDSSQPGNGGTGGGGQGNINNTLTPNTGSGGGGGATPGASGASGFVAYRVPLTIPTVFGA